MRRIPLTLLMAACLTLACDVAARGGGGQSAVAGAAEVTATSARVAAPITQLDSVLLNAAFDGAARMPRLRSLLVSWRGELVREAFFHGATRNTHANIKSASKSIISALVGIAIAEGRLAGVDQPIAPLFASYVRGNADPRIHDVTIGHLLSMQAGLEPTSFDNYGAWVSSGNWVRSALTRRFVDDPGGRMLYSGVLGGGAVGFLLPRRVWRAAPLH